MRRLAVIICSLLLTLAAHAQDAAPLLAWVMAGGSNPDVLSGLVAWWKFDGNANDSAGTNNGVAYGTSVVAGKTGLGYSFNGNNSYVEVGQNAFGTNDLTISVWIFPVAKTQLYPCIFNNYTTWGAGALGIFVGHKSGNATKYQVACNGTFPAIQSTASITYGYWSFITLVRYGSVFTLYVNGVPNGTYSDAYNVTGSGEHMWIGRAQDYPSTPVTIFNGLIDDVRIYNRALTSNEVVRIYNLFK